MLPKKLTHRLMFAVPVLVALGIVLAWSCGWLTWWLLHFARQALANRDYDTASMWVNRASTLDQFSAEAEFLRARIERKLGHLDVMDQHLKRAETLGAERRLVRRERLLAQAQAGELAEIVSEMDKMLVEHSEDGADICEAYVNGLFISGQFDEAEFILQQWQVAFPQDPFPDYLRGRVAEFHHRAKEAEQFHRRSLEKNPQFLLAVFALGRTLCEFERWPEALELYRRGLSFRVSAPAQIGMARCLSHLGRTEEALRYLYEAANVPQDILIEALKQLGEPTEYDTLACDLGTLEANLGHHKEAIRWLRRAVSYNSQHRQSRYQLALALNATGQVEEAKSHLDWYAAQQAKLDERDRLHDVVQSNPQDNDARFRLGQLYLETDSEAAGVFWLRSVLASDPQHRATHAAFAELYEAKAKRDRQFQSLAEHHRAQAQK